MGKRRAEFTRARKVILSQLTDEYRSASVIRADEKDLNALQKFGLADAILEHGEMIYRLSDSGTEWLQKHVKAGEDA